MQCHCNGMTKSRNIRTLFYLSAWRDAQIWIISNFLPKFPLPGFRDGMWKPKSRYRRNAVAFQRIKLYFTYVIQLTTSKAEALNCSATVMDGIKTHFWANFSILISHYEWKIGISASPVPSISFQCCSNFFPAENSKKEWLSTCLVVPLQWINAVWAYIKN